MIFNRHMENECNIRGVDDIEIAWWVLVGSLGFKHCL
jgi:hypothetical protein